MPKRAEVTEMLPERQVLNVCRLGGGEATCAFLGIGSDGALCIKTEPNIAAEIRSRLAEGSMTAKGDNCSGPPDYRIDAT